MDTKVFEKLYLEKKYEDALKILLSNSQLNAKDHYNLGTVLAKLEKYPLAKYHLEKSIKESWFFPGAKNNLSFVNQKLNIVSQEHFLSELSIVSSLSNISMFSMLNIFLALFIFLSVIYRNKTIKAFLIKFSLSAVIPIFIFAFQHNMTSSIVKENQKVYESPSKIFSPLYEIKAGEKIFYRIQNDSWAYIEYPKELQGWILKSELWNL